MHVCVCECVKAELLQTQLGPRLHVGGLCQTCPTCFEEAKGANEHRPQGPRPRSGRKKIPQN